MAVVYFEELFDTMKTGVTTLANNTITDYATEASKAGQDALDEMKGDLDTWSKSITAGVMNIEDLKFLIAGRKELTEMQGLEQLGIAQIELDKFQNGIVDMIVASVSKIL